MAFISLILGDADQVKNSATITRFQQDDPMDGPEEVYPLFRKDGETTNRLKKSEMDDIINFDIFSVFAYNNEWFAKTFIPVDGVTEISEDEFRNKVTEIINNLPDDAPIIAMVCDGRKNY